MIYLFSCGEQILRFRKFMQVIALVAWRYREKQRRTVRRNGAEKGGDKRERKSSMASEKRSKDKNNAKDKGKNVMGEKETGGLIREENLSYTEKRKEK